ncbi:MAG: prolyl-tRNA synthetase associated domain-containing protein [Prevotellaceae bacterium]|nr:prolyl-tRNA synthetase associated domain-containing protein [Prevotellaceae bacterium]
MNRRAKVFQTLQQLGVPYTVYEHPAAATVEVARRYWDAIPEPAQHCKNLFFRNHKGNRHYLVILDCRKTLSVHALEQRLKQGKLSFASAERMQKYLGTTPGSVSLFGLVNDAAHHVHVFIDADLQQAGKVSFHPNDNTASVILAFADAMRFLRHCGNPFEWFPPDDGEPSPSAGA